MPDPGYTVRRAHDCIVVTGAIPLHEAGALLQAWAAINDDLIVCSDLAEKLGATLVVGTKRACAAWWEAIDRGQGDDA